ncbi:MAG: YjbQ family protein [Proteobacteria bacterium]|jgi:secondary thiamine-phosphate synthase enzyme|nr:YjbQ family protein [Pseudomonadota bacterium]
MPVEHRTVAVETRKRGASDITSEIAAAVHSMGVDDGLAHLFLQHTSASLIIQENADPSVLSDLEDWLVRHVPDGDPRYRHSQEGPDDMSAHIKTMLTATSLTVPIEGGRLALGTWQGIYLFEHRTQSHRRRVVVSVVS